MIAFLKAKSWWRLTAQISRDYNGHMIKTLRESKAKLSALVELANRGEDVLISVRGKVKARLTSAGATTDASDRTRWVRELRRLQNSWRCGVTHPTVDEILSQHRGDRI